MYCKWCGMDSKDDKRCDWCGRPLVASDAEQSADTQATTAIPQVTTAMDPQPSVTQAMPSTPDATTAMPPVEGDPSIPFNRSMTGMKKIEIEVVELPPFSVRMEKYLGVMTVLLAIGMAVAHYMPQIWYVPMFMLVFLTGLLLGSFRVIDYMEEAYLEIGVFIVACGFMGPLYAAVVYLLFGLAKSNVDWSLFGLAVSCVLIRLFIGAAAHGWGDTINYLLTFRIEFNYFHRALLILPGCVLIMGWMAASFTRPLNE